MKMMIARPSKIAKEKREELEKYLTEMWDRAVKARQTQVDDDYSKWSKAYSGVPLEAIRTVPFYRSSNFVVKLIRMFIDTFCARSLNVLFATRPMYNVEGLPKELKNIGETYLNRKALYQWDHYNLTREMCFRGSKNGTAVIKNPWVRNSSWRVTADAQGVAEEHEYINFEGPNSRVIPFEDFYAYPIEANYLCDTKIRFHKLRYTAEEAKEKVASGDLVLPDGETVDTLLRKHNDAKRLQEQADANVQDSQYTEMQFVECQLKYNIYNDGKYYDIIATLEESTKQLVDLYFDPYPGHADLYHVYKPMPREDIFYGESVCQLLGQSQEEASTIHNDRRNNSFIANAVCFKRRSGSLLPNPSTSWYPGKVWDLESMDDLELFNIGRNYDDMLQQEDYVFMLAQKLSGISDVMQGASQGEMSKRGIYNTSGTLAVMSEGAQRQDTNIRDIRQVLSGIGFSNMVLQSTFGVDDPYVQTFDDKDVEDITKLFAYLSSSKGQYCRLEVKASDAGANREVKRANLLQMMQVIGQYGQAVQSMVTQLANTQINPSLRAALNDISKMMKWMAGSLLQEFDEHEALELLPDVAAAIELTVPGGSRGTKDDVQGAANQLPLPGGSQGPQEPVSKSLLASLSSMDVPSGRSAAA